MPFAFKKPLWITLGAFLVFCVWVISQWKVTPEAMTLYKGLETPDDKGTLTHFSEQVREGVVKEMWLQEAKGRAARIASQESHLFFFWEDKTFEVIEQLRDVKCFVREDAHTIRYLEARQASFNYNTKLFVATDVKLWKFEGSGEGLPSAMPTSAPLMSAVAESVEFVLDESDFTLRAHRLKATLSGKAL